MSKDPTAVANLIKKNGKYDWYIGKAGDSQRDKLLTFVTPSALENLVKFNKTALGLKSVYKEDLAK